MTQTTDYAIGGMPPALLIRWLRGLTFAFLLALSYSVLAQTEEPVSEHQIKAAFLFKFGGYVDWPAQAFETEDSPFVIGVLGADEVAGSLAVMVAGRNINGRRVEIRRLQDGDSPVDVHVLFVGRAAGSRPALMSKDAISQPVLIVTETDDARSGGAINFVVVDNKVRFDVMLASAEARNLKISARLLGVARSVIDGSS